MRTTDLTPCPHASMRRYPVVYMTAEHGNRPVMILHMPGDGTVYLRPVRETEPRVWRPIDGAPLMLLYRPAVKLTESIDALVWDGSGAPHWLSDDYISAPASQTALLSPAEAWLRKGGAR